MVLDGDDLGPVGVDQTDEPFDGPRIRVAAGIRGNPGERADQPPPLKFVVPPGPDGHRVDPHQLELLACDPSPGQRSLEVRVRLDDSLDQLVLLRRHGRLQSLQLAAVDQRASRQRHHGFVGALRHRVEEHDLGLALRRRS